MSVNANIADLLGASCAFMQSEAAYLAMGIIILVAVTVDRFTRGGKR